MPGYEVEGVGMSTIGCAQLVNVWRIWNPQHDGFQILEILPAHENPTSVEPDDRCQIVLQFLAIPGEDETQLDELILTALSLQSWPIATLKSRPAAHAGRRATMSSTYRHKPGSMIPELRRRAQENPLLCARCGEPRTIIAEILLTADTTANVVDTLQLPVCNACTRDLFNLPSFQLVL